MVESGPWFVYIVRARSGKLYTGITKDVERRIAEHSGDRRGAKFFRTSPPDRVVYREACSRRSEAARREVEIKRMTRTAKLRLIRDAECE